MSKVNHAAAERLERDIRKLEERHGVEKVRHRVLTAENTFPATARTVIPQPVVLAPLPPPPDALLTEDEFDDAPVGPSIGNASAAQERPIQRGLLAGLRRRYF